MTKRGTFNLQTPGVELLPDLGVLRAGDHMAETHHGLNNVLGEPATAHPHSVVDHKDRVERFLLWKSYKASKLTTLLLTI